MAEQAAHTAGKTASKKIGGLPVWGWIAIAAGGVLVLSKFSSGAASSSAQPVTYSPIVPNNSTGSGSGAATQAFYDSVSSQLTNQQTQLSALEAYMGGLGGGANTSGTGTQTGGTQTGGTQTGGTQKGGTQTGGSTPKTMRFANPAGQIFEATNYQQGVNMAGGYYRNHVFIHGRYVGGKFKAYPTAKHTTPSQQQQQSKQKRKIPRQGAGGGSKVYATMGG